MSAGYSRRALADLRKIAEYVSLRSPRGAASVMRRIAASADLFGRHPGVGTKVKVRHGLRALPVGNYPYRIYYKIEAGAPIIVHIRHGARALPRPDEMA